MFNEKVLLDILNSFEVDTHTWGQGDAKSITNLCEEISKKETVLQIDSTGLFRIVRVVKMLIIDHDLGTLVEQYQILPDGRKRVRNMMPGGKVMGNETPLQTLHREAREEMAWTPEMYSVNNQTVSYKNDESPSYPGLWNKYEFHCFELRVRPSIVNEIREGFGHKEKDGTEHFFAWRK
ncbi:MAG: NUDIX domain-containing protein [bacterium]